MAGHAEPMDQQAKGTFEMTRWDAESYDEQEGATLSRAQAAKTFEGGIEGTSTLQLLMANAQQGSAGYVGHERITGSVDGRSGSFVLQHAAVGSSTGGTMSVAVVPDSGTGELAGVSGELQIDRHEDGSHSYVFDYELG